MVPYSVVRLRMTYVRYEKHCVPALAFITSFKHKEFCAVCYGGKIYPTLSGSYLVLAHFNHSIMNKINLKKCTLFLNSCS